MDVIARIAEELSVRPQQVSATVALLDEGATVPFIARYRKEVTGNLDDAVACGSKAGSPSFFVIEDTGNATV